MEMLEDTHADILTKAMVGQLMPVNQAAEKLGEPSKAIRAVVDGAVDLGIIRKLAAALNLAPDALCAIAEQKWQPNVTTPKGVFRIETEFRGEISSTCPNFPSMSNLRVTLEPNPPFTGLNSEITRHASSSSSTSIMKDRTRSPDELK